MDGFTHVLSGFVIGNLISLNNWTLILFTIIASLIPDIDILLAIFEDKHYIKHHRNITHGPLGIIILAGILSYIFSFFIKDFITLFVIAVFTIVVHIALDLTNAYGTRILSPFKEKLYALDILPETDPWIYLMLIGVSVVFIFFKDYARIAEFCFLISFVFYLLLRVIFYILAYNQIRKYYKKTNFYLDPTRLNPLTFRVILIRGADYKTFYYNIITCRESDIEKFKKIQAKMKKFLKTAELPRIYLKFSKFPIVKQNNRGKGRLMLVDVRFINNGKKSLFVNIFTKNKKIKKSELKY
ncbi:MAG: metal-dependent hydrolase [Candidatus Woesearchaeota archaeon]